MMKQHLVVGKLVLENNYYVSKIVVFTINKYEMYFLNRKNHDIVEK